MEGTVGGRANALKVVWSDRLLIVRQTAFFAN